MRALQNVLHNPLRFYKITYSTINQMLPSNDYEKQRRRAISCNVASNLILTLEEGSRIDTV